MSQSKILIADDSETNRLLLSFMLRELSYQVTEVENGERAVELALEHNYDAIFMDINMPVMSGLDATNMLRNIGYDSAIFACSAEDCPAKIKSFLSSGFTDFLPKPLNINEVSLVLNKHLSKTPKESINHLGFEKKIAQLSNRFIENIPVFITKITQALDNHSTADLKRIAHKLKGTASQFGFESIGIISKDIESSIKNGKLTIAIEQSNFLITELKKIKQSNR